MPVFREVGMACGAVQVANERSRMDIAYRVAAKDAVDMACLTDFNPLIEVQPKKGSALSQFPSKARDPTEIQIGFTNYQRKAPESASLISSGASFPPLPN
jgi:hypothetical protein